MKKALQRQDNLRGLTLDNVKGATKAEQKAYLLGLKRPLFEVEKQYLKTL